MSGREEERAKIVAYLVEGRQDEQTNGRTI